MYQTKYLYLLAILGFIVIGCTSNPTGPLNIPLPSGAEISIDEQIQMVFAIDQPTEEMVTFYQEEMANNGWEFRTETTVQANQGDILIQKFEKDSEAVEIAFAVENGKTLVSIIVVGSP